MKGRAFGSATRRRFLQTVGVGAGAAALGLPRLARAAEEETPIPGFEKTAPSPDASKGWQPLSDRKIRVGLVGFGVCQMGAAFGFQDHPNVEVVAVSDLIPERRDGLAKATRCSKTYDSLEELVKDDTIEAVFCGTDAPSHARHTLEVLRHGKHVGMCVPAVWGSVDEAHEVFEAVKETGLKYMLFETSCYHEDLHAMREIYNAGGLGKLVFSEGEYYHYSETQIPSFKEWRVGVPPQWYPTHSNAYYVCVTGGSFTEVSCQAMPSWKEPFKSGKNQYKNPFATEVALLRTSEGGMARMAVSWDTPGDYGERGRIRGQRGTFNGKYDGLEKNLPNTTPPPLPPTVDPGGHGGSHGYLMNEFVTAILEDRTPLVNVAWALNMTVAGVVAHKSALKDGERMKIPQFAMPGKTPKQA